MYSLLYCTLVLTPLLTPLLSVTHLLTLYCTHSFTVFTDVLLQTCGCFLIYSRFAHLLVLILRYSKKKKRGALLIYLPLTSSSIFFSCCSSSSLRVRVGDLLMRVRELNLIKLQLPEILNCADYCQRLRNPVVCRSHALIEP